MTKTNSTINLKKALLLIAAIFCAVLCLAHPASAATKTSVKTLAAGKTYTVKNTSKVKSSNTAVVTAKKKSSSRYTLTANKKGVSTISVYDKNGKLSQKVYLIVYNNKTFKYNSNTVNMAVGKTKTVQASTNISGMSIKYKSADTSVATVSSQGKITAKKAGSTTIKALFYYKNVKVNTVKKKVNVYSSSYNTKTITLTEGKTKTVAASVSSNCSVKYASSDKTIAKVNSKGKITAVKKGTATITCGVYLGKTLVKSYTKTVKVTAASTGSTSSSSSGGSGAGTGSTSSSSASSDGDSYKYRCSPSSVTVAGGRSSEITGYTTKSSDTFEFVVNDKNGVISDCDYVEGTCYDPNYGCQCYYLSIQFAGRIAGSCEIKVYLNGSLLKTVPVTVTSTDTDYFEYESWRTGLEKELWTSGMSCYDKIVAVGNYVFGKYPYNANHDSVYAYMWGEGGDCYSAAGLLIDVAHDLGLQAEAYFVNGKTYGHAQAKIYLDDGRIFYAEAAYTSSTQPYGKVAGHFE